MSLIPRTSLPFSLFSLPRLSCQDFLFSRFSFSPCKILVAKIFVFSLQDSCFQDFHFSLSKILVAQISIFSLQDSCCQDFNFSRFQITLSQYFSFFSFPDHFELASQSSRALCIVHTKSLKKICFWSRFSFHGQ